MANYYATARTSYVKVRDHKKFLAWAETIPDCEVITKAAGDDGTLYGLMFGMDSDCGGIPCWRDSSDELESEDLDIYSEIQTHIATGWSITFQEVGAEKCRYLTGFASIVTPSSIHNCSLDSWVADELRRLGNPQSTSCSY